MPMSAALLHLTLLRLEACAQHTSHVPSHALCMPWLSIKTLRPSVNLSCSSMHDVCQELRVEILRDELSC